MSGRSSIIAQRGVAFAAASKGPWPKTGPLRNMSSSPEKPFGLSWQNSTAQLPTHDSKFQPEKMASPSTFITSAQQREMDEALARQEPQNTEPACGEFEVADLKPLRVLLHPGHASPTPLDTKADPVATTGSTGGIVSSSLSNTKFYALYREKSKLHPVVFSRVVSTLAEKGVVFGEIFSQDKHEAWGCDFFTELGNGLRKCNSEKGKGGEGLLLSLHQLGAYPPRDRPIHHLSCMVVKPSGETHICHHESIPQAGQKGAVAPSALASSGTIHNTYATQGEFAKRGAQMEDGLLPVEQSMKIYGAPGVMMTVVPKPDEGIAWLNYQVANNDHTHNYQWMDDILTTQSPDWEQRVLPNGQRAAYANTCVHTSLAFAIACGARSGKVGGKVGSIDDSVFKLSVTDTAEWDPLESTCRHASLSIL